MGKRVVAAAAVAAVAGVIGASPALAQAYPPPVNTITVDDATPAPGQAVTVTLRTCRAGTPALFGLDLGLLGSAPVGADGVARGTITIPGFTRPGSHAVVGVCAGVDRRLLVLHTDIRVTAASADSSGPSGGGPGGGGGHRRSGRSGPAAARPPMPSAAGLVAGAVPADATTLFGTAAAATGITGGGGDDGGPPADGRPAGDAAGISDDGPGTLSTIGRVALGVTALAGVPVGLALSRGPGGQSRRRLA